MKRNLITVDEAVVISGYGPQHIRFLIHSREIDAERVGSIFLIDPASLEKYKEYMGLLGNKKFGLRRGRSKTYPGEVKDHESTGKEAKKEGANEHRTNSIRFNRR